MSYSQYIKYKNIYDDRIVLIKEGTFYCSYNIDALIIKDIFKYKIINYETFIKVSIPNKKIDTFINKLRINKLPLVIINKNIINYSINDSKYDNLHSYILINDIYIYIYKKNI